MSREELSAEELAAESADALPNREAMSVISTGEPMQWWASDPAPVPPGQEDPSAFTDPPPDYKATDPLTASAATASDATPTTT